MVRERVELSDEEKVKEDHNIDSPRKRRKVLEEERGICSVHLLHEGEPEEVSSGHLETVQVPAVPTRRILGS